MTTSLNLAYPSPTRSTWNAAVTLTGDIIANAYRLWQCRREAHALQRLSDEQLHDIGLRRADVALSLALPPSRDPTLALTRIAEERRASYEPLRNSPLGR